MFSEVEIEIFIVFKEQSWRKFFVLFFFVCFFFSFFFRFGNTTLIYTTLIYKYHALDFVKTNTTAQTTENKRKTGFNPLLLS